MQITFLSDIVPWLKEEAERYQKQAAELEQGTATEAGCYTTPDWQEKYAEAKRLYGRAWKLLEAARVLEDR